MLVSQRVFISGLLL